MKAEPISVGFRLRSAQGHLDGVIRMVEEDRYCIDVLHQLSAVHGALERVRRDILESHLRMCLPEAVTKGRINEAVDEVVAAALGGPARAFGEGEHRCRHHAASGRGA